MDFFGKMGEVSESNKERESEFNKESLDKFNKLFEEDNFSGDEYLAETAENKGRSKDLQTDNPWGFPEISERHSMWKDLKDTNPFYKTDYAYRINCQRCVSAYEARRRGYDVVAKPKPLMDDLCYGDKERGWPSVYDNPELVTCSGDSGKEVMKAVKNQMKEYGDGARAVIEVRWLAQYGGGGHVFIAEQVNGRTYFIDPQNNGRNCERYFNMTDKTVRVMRVDQLEFIDRIKECCEGR